MCTHTSSCSYRYPSEMEFHLRNARPLSRQKEKPNTIYDPAYTRYDLPRLDPLPPVEPKPQVSDFKSVILSCLDLWNF